MSSSDFFSQVLASQDRSGREGRIYGLVFAEVTALTAAGCELKFFGPPGSTSAPARLATMMAGNQRGSFFMPEVGDEVVVGFERGDVNRPVIQGAHWSDKDLPPQGADTGASNNTRMIVSRSGHEVLLDDSPGAGKVTIKTSGGMEITLEDTPPKITIKTTGTVATSRIVLDGVAWNHQHATGVGPSGPPISIVPVI